MSNRGAALSLSTEITEAELFLVDGEEYKLLGIDHLSPEEEATALALFARHSLLNQQLELTENVQRGEEVAKKLRRCRLLVLTKLTTLPMEIAEKLPLSQQAQLFEAIEDEMGVKESASAEGLASSRETPAGGSSLEDEDL